MAKKVVIKEDTAQLVFKKVKNAISAIKTGVKEEKFDKELKKASKHLAKEIFKTVKKASSEKPVKNKKTGTNDKAEKPNAPKKEKGVEKPKGVKSVKNKKVKVTVSKPETITKEIVAEVTN